MGEADEIFLCGTCRSDAATDHGANHPDSAVCLAGAGQLYKFRIDPAFDMARIAACGWPKTLTRTRQERLGYLPATRSRYGVAG